MDITITELNKELNEFEREYKSHLDSTVSKSDIPDFQSKLNKIYELSTDKVTKNCHKELDVLNSLLESDIMTSNKMLPLPGKEKEAKNAYKNFYFCAFYPSSLLHNYEQINISLINLNKNQMKLCKADCINKSEMNLDKAKNCLRKCLDFSFNYSRIATYDIIDSILENTEKEMKKI